MLTVILLSDRHRALALIYLFLITDESVLETIIFGSGIYILAKRYFLDVMFLSLYTFPLVKVDYSYKPLCILQWITACQNEHGVYLHKRWCHMRLFNVIHVFSHISSLCTSSRQYSRGCEPSTWSISWQSENYAYSVSPWSICILYIRKTLLIVWSREAGKNQMLQIKTRLPAKIAISIT